MIKIYSRIDKNLLLHTINRMSDIDSNEKDRIDLSPDEEFIQVAGLKLGLQKTFRPHKHIYRKGEKEVIPQESWVVIKGSVMFYIYDIDDSLIETTVLYPGDCSITFRGGHTYKSLEEGTIVYEFKTGPYKGQIFDKVFI